jgi:hypothetical protein
MVSKGVTKLLVLRLLCSLLALRRQLWRVRHLLSCGLWSDRVQFLLPFRRSSLLDPGEEANVDVEELGGAQQIDAAVVASADEGERQQHPALQQHRRIGPECRLLSTKPLTQNRKRGSAVSLRWP